MALLAISGVQDAGHTGAAEDTRNGIRLISCMPSNCSGSSPQIDEARFVGR